MKEKYIEVKENYGYSIDVSGSDLQEKFNALFPLSIGEDKKIEASLLTSSPGGLTPKMMQVVLESVIRQLEKVLKHVSHFKWRSPATSVLIVFEGDARRLEKVVESDGQIKAKLSAVKLIDFPYAEEHDQVDKGLILGLKNTLKHFQELYKTIDNFQKQQEKNYIVAGPVTP